MGVRVCSCCISFYIYYGAGHKEPLNSEYRGIPLSSAIFRDPHIMKHYHHTSDSDIFRHLLVSLQGLACLSSMFSRLPVCALPQQARCARSGFDQLDADGRAKPTKYCITQD
jgi:hypothetical protein